MEADRRTIVRRSSGQATFALASRGGWIGSAIALTSSLSMQLFISKCEADYRRDETIQRNVGVWDLKGCDKASL